MEAIGLPAAADAAGVAAAPEAAGDGVGWTGANVQLDVVLPDAQAPARRRTAAAARNGRRYVIFISPIVTQPAVPRVSRRA
jgi:hypothetical protein